LPISILSLESYLDDFNNGLPPADLDDGSGLGLPDGGVAIEDLQYFLDCLGKAAQNNNCATPLSINLYNPSGYGRFAYQACTPGFTAAIAPTTGVEGQNNKGGGRCVGAVYQTTIPNDVWFLWTAPPGAGLTLINTVSFAPPLLTTDDTRIAVYGFSSTNAAIPPCAGTIGAACPSGGTAVVAVGYNEDSGGTSPNKQARVAFRAIPGNTYRIQIGGVSVCGALQNEIFRFEIIDMATPLHTARRFTSTIPAFPGALNSYRVTCHPPCPLAFAPTEVTTQNAACTAALPCGLPGNGNLFSNFPRRCADLGPNAGAPANTHLVLELRYGGLNPSKRCALRLGHKPSNGLNPNIWVNARCANDINAQIITAVIDSFSPIAITEEGCAADTNEDGGIGIEDLLLYLEMYDQGSDEADIDLDGGVGIEDLLDYLTRYDVGC
jgi:hypothetical protein